MAVLKRSHGSWLTGWICLIVSSLHLSGAPLPLQGRIQSLFSEHKDTIVRVKAVYGAGSEEGELPQLVIGSGFFISREGLILTNASVVNDPLRVWIEHENIAYSADIVGIDNRSNIALLRVNRLPDQFGFLHLVDDSDLPPIGTFVLRLGMPLEFNVSPEIGIVSGYESRFGDRFFPCKYIRTTVNAGPGDGGAAYLDLDGRLIGIQVGALPEVASSYLLPSRAALRVRDDLLFSGEVNYGWVGFEVEERASIADGQFLVIKETLENGPATGAGLLPGDRLVRVGAYAIRDLDDLRNAMFYSRVGQFIEIEIDRDGETEIFSVQLTQRPEEEPFQVPVESGEFSNAAGTPLKSEAVQPDGSMESAEEG